MMFYVGMSIPQYCYLAAYLTLARHLQIRTNIKREEIEKEMHPIIVPS